MGTGGHVRATEPRLCPPCFRVGTEVEFYWTGGSSFPLSRLVSQFLGSTEANIKAEE